MYKLKYLFVFNQPIALDQLLLNIQKFKLLFNIINKNYPFKNALAETLTVIEIEY